MRLVNSKLRNSPVVGEGEAMWTNAWRRLHLALQLFIIWMFCTCLLYTSDAADDYLEV